MNRTKPGETVTDDKVFLGNIFGLSTKTVAYWRTREGEPKGGWEGGTWSGYPALQGKNPYDVVSDQASAFMNSHIDPMMIIINNDLVRPAAYKV